MKQPPPYRSVLERFPDHTKAIGMTSIEIANLDIFLGHFFGALLQIGQDAGAAIYLTPKSAFARLEILEAAINSIYNGSEDKDNHNHFTSLLKRARKIVSARHSLIHDSWGTNAAGDPARRDIKALGPMIPVDVKQLEQSIHDIRVLIGDIKKAIHWLEQFASKPK
jgi:hypothetical protein